MDIFSKSDDRLFNYFAKAALEEIFLDKPQTPHGGGQDRWWVIPGLLLIVGTEPFKVLLRKNIGKLALSFPRLVVACILYFLWALAVYFLIHENSLEGSTLPNLWISNTSLMAVVAFYVLFGLATIVLGISEKNRPVSSSGDEIEDIRNLVHRGDSLFFSTNSSKAVIWVWREPAICFMLSVVLTIINPFLGIPLLSTSISFWFNEWFQVNNVWNAVDERITNYLSRNSNTKSSFSSNDDFPFVQSR